MVRWPRYGKWIDFLEHFLSVCLFLLNSNKSFSVVLRLDGGNGETLVLVGDPIFSYTTNVENGGFDDW